MATKHLVIIAAGIAATSIASPAVGAEVGPQSLSNQRQALMPQDVKTLVPGATDAILVTGKRPPLKVGRPGWVGELSGESLITVRFDQAFEKLDKNHDGLLTWAVIDAQGKLHADQAGAEPLPAVYDACYLIDYTHHPAKSEKDPAHPGQYLQTPESYEITGWRTWREALAVVDGAGYAGQTPTGVCNKMEMVKYCKKGAFEMPQTCNSWTGCNCHHGFNGYTVIQKEVCVEKQTVPTAFTKEQWLKLAKDHFQREDWNHDGKLDAAESKEYVCALE